MGQSLIEEIISSDVLPTRDQLTQVVASCVRPDARSELSIVDFKQDFDSASNKDWLELLKDIVSMANAGGGILIFGVEKNGNVTGCSSNLLRVLDPAAVVDKLRKYAPQVSVQVNPFEIEYEGSRVLLLLIKRGTRIILFERDGQYEDPTTKRSKTVFYPGIVYTRTTGGNAPARQMDIDQMVSYFAGQQIQRMVSRIGQVAALPPGTDLIATDPANPSEGYRLLDHGLGMPVRIVPRDDDDEGVPLTEVLAPHIPYTDVNAEIAGQVRHWRQVSNSHRVDRATLARWYLDREHIVIDERGLAFCMLSACHMYGFPMYWAALLSRERLRELLNQMVAEDSHPDRTAIPYVAAAFFWKDRASVLAPLVNHTKVTVRSAVLRLTAMSDRQQFLRTVRYGAETFKIDNTQYRMADFVADRELAQRTFEDLVRRDIQEDLMAAKQIAYQLDILLHAPQDEE